MAWLGVTLVAILFVSMFFHFFPGVSNSLCVSLASLSLSPLPLSLFPSLALSVSLPSLSLEFVSIRTEERSTRSQSEQCARRWSCPSWKR